MLQKATLQHLRIIFSFFLMPVFLFAVSQAEVIDISNAILLFMILHVLVYPSSNLYNSYMDRDTASIGAVENPLPVVPQMFYVSIVLDVLAVLLCLYISFKISGIIFMYILFSRMYSSRIVRLKKYPFLGYLTVVCCQGALIYYVVAITLNPNVLFTNIYFPMIISSCMIGAFYPLTQVYQHKQDAADGVKTISMLLGIRNTFAYCAFLFFISFLLLSFYFYFTHHLNSLLMYAIILSPLVLYFYTWMKKVFKDENKADYTHLMNMNILSATLSNIAYVLLIFIK